MVRRINTHAEFLILSETARHVRRQTTAFSRAVIGSQPVQSFIGRAFGQYGYRAADIVAARRHAV